jgi:hypothetical protein
LSEATSLPPWAETVLGLSETFDDIDEDEQLSEEAVGDSNLVIQLLENISFLFDVDTPSDDCN